MEILLIPSIQQEGIYEVKISIANFTDNKSGYWVYYRNHQAEVNLGLFLGAIGLVLLILYGIFLYIKYFRDETLGFFLGRAIRKRIS